MMRLRISIMRSSADRLGYLAGVMAVVAVVVNSYAQEPDRAAPPLGVGSCSESKVRLPGHHRASLESAELREMRFAQLASQVRALEEQGCILSQVVSLVRPSVVHIEADKKTTQIAVSEYGEIENRTGTLDEANQPLQFIEEAGSGTVVEIDGSYYVLTNRHVIQDADLPGIRLVLSNGRVLHPKRMWADASTDVALLRVDETDLIPARMGNSDTVKIGEFVLAFGSPFGLSHSVSHGIISAKGRRDLSLGNEDVHIQDFMQTDAAINPGNSGGPLLNLRGEVIGINTAIASNSGGNEGIGFSIPINMAIHVARELAKKGQLVRAYLGVQLSADFDAEKAQELGVPCYGGTQVTKVTVGSPADDAAILAGDVIVQFGEAQVEDDCHLVKLVGMTPIHTVVPTILYRDGQEMTVMVELRPRH